MPLSIVHRSSACVYPKAILLALRDLPPTMTTTQVPKYFVANECRVLLNKKLDVTHDHVTRVKWIYICSFTF